MRLNTLCSDPKIRTRLNFLVTKMNRLLGEAYAFMNFHTLRVIRDGNPPLTVDRDLSYRCLVAASDSDARPATLGDDFMNSVKAFDALRPEPKAAPSTPAQSKVKGKGAKISSSNPLGKDKVDIRGHVQVVADLFRVMETMVSNHLWTNLAPRIEKYLVWKHPTLKRFHKAITRAVVTEPTKAAGDVIAAAAVYFKQQKERAPSEKQLAVQSAKADREARKAEKQLAAQAAKAEKDSLDALKKAEKPSPLPKKARKPTDKQLAAQATKDARATE